MPKKIVVDKNILKKKLFFFPEKQNKKTKNIWRKYNLTSFISLKRFIFNAMKKYFKLRIKI